MDLYSEEEYLKILGENLKKFREIKGFTQSELASDLGIEISQISRIERGIINTSIYNLYRISKILDIELELLLNLPHSID